MVNSESQDSSGGLVLCLHVVAVLSAIASGGMGLWLAFPLAGSAAAGDWLLGTGVLIIGLVVGVWLWAMAWLVRKRRESLRVQERLAQSLRNLQPSQAGTEANSAPAAMSEPILRQILEQLAELNANTLLTSEEREAKRLRKRSELAERLSRQITAAAREESFDEAAQLLERLREEIPDDPHLEELRLRIEEGRREQTRRILQGRMQRAADLMAVARFDEAIDVAEQLHREHPEHPETDGLLERVKRQAQTFEYEQRRRLYSELHAHGEARHWKQALEVAHRLMDNYPDSTEATQLKSLLPTLVDNARLEEVRQLRDRFVDLVERRRYPEAAELAKHVADNYPETTAAEELRAQLPRLHELAFKARNKSNLP
jgi:tetratricopeptide (TPR) repeat protein